MLMHIKVGHFRLDQLLPLAGIRMERTTIVGVAVAVGLAHQQARILLHWRISR